jgi:O-antigen/teichoic acid export membrane protein
MIARLKKLPNGIKHSIWGVLDAALYPVAYMATVPILMHSMGLLTFGLWIVLNTIMTVLQLFNFNMGITAIRNVSYELANGNTQKVTDLINGILHITLILLAVAIGAGAFLSLTAVKFGWWNLNAAPVANVSLCVLFAAIIAGLKYFDQVFQNVIKAQERFRLAAILNMTNRFGILIINLTLALSKFSILQMLSADIVFMLCYLIAQYICIKKLMPFYKHQSVKDKSQYKRIFQFSTWTWLQALIIVIAFQTDRFWVSTYAGLSEVSGYGLVSTMFNHIHMIFIAMAAWMLPRISAMTSRGHSPAELYNTVRGILFVIIVISLLSFYFVSPILFDYWVGGDTYQHMHGYIRGFVGFEIVFAHTILSFMYLNASGKEKLATKVALLYCGLCYGFMIAGLMIFHSTIVMVAGMTLAICITMPVVNYAVMKSMDQPFSWETALLEMIPMYSAILLLYSQNVWLNIVLIVTIVWLLWKFYLANIIINRTWRPAPKA